MIRCHQCQHENAADAAFCDECGARLEAACPSCGEPNRAGAKFCRRCGHVVPQAGDSRTSRSPQSYTPKHLAEKILTSKTALEGERKQVTVLFADLKGSMELLADRDPEEARKLLDPVLEHMMEAVHHYEGTVNQVMGDGIMALFGAPLAQEDHAVRACYTALRMQESVRRYATGIFHSHGVSIQIRIGLNSGEVVVRAIGSDLHMDYTAVGQTTHLAARMEQLAEPGTALLAPATLALAEGFVQVTARGPVPVKGLRDAVEVFALIGASPVRSRLHAAAAHELSRFVGRNVELDLLRRALSLAESGRGQVVGIVGEPGVGKSRLVWEFTHSHRSAGWLLLEAASVSYGKATTYLPVIELLRSYFQIEGRDDQRRIREKITGKLLSLDRTLETALPVFFSLLDVAGVDSTWERLDPAQRRRLTLDALKRLLLRESQVQPLLLVFEDLHWIDTETQTLLDLLVESLPTAPVLLLVNYRPEYTHAWNSKTSYQQLRLDALPIGTAVELLDALLGTDPGLGDLKRLLIARTQGNPFFLEESVRALVETKALAGARSDYALSGPLRAPQLPPTVQAILAARIDRLTPEDKRLLQAAAVIGKDVPYALLHAVAEIPEDALRAGLARLQTAEFLYETRLFPDLEHTFKHALTHEVAAAGILTERRRTLHARLVETIERLYPERLEEHVEQLGWHALRGERWQQAVDYNRRAGVRAYRRPAYAEAVTAFERAIEALDHLGESPDTLGQAIDLRVLLRDGLVNAGQPDRSLDVSRTVLERAEALGDANRKATAAASLTNSLYLCGRSSEAAAAGGDALALAEALGDLAVLAKARWNLAQACEAVGDHQRVIELMNANLDLCAQQPDLVGQGSMLGSTIVETMSRTWLAWSLAERGEFDRATMVAQAAVSLGERSGLPFGAVGGVCGVGVVHARRGHVGNAIPHLERALELCTSYGFRIWFPCVAGHLGHVFTLDGRLAEARDLLRRAVEAGASDQRVHQSLWLTWLGETHLLSGDLEKAAGVATDALAMARNRGERGNEVRALKLQAEIAAAADPPATITAEARYNDARALADELGMRPLAAHCHLGLGKLYRRTDRRHDAREHLTTATAMYREMDMRFWLEQAEAELRKLDEGSS